MPQVAERSMSSRALGRRLKDYKQRALGRRPLRFQFELVPYSVSECCAVAGHACVPGWHTLI